MEVKRIFLDASVIPGPDGISKGEFEQIIDIIEESTSPRTEVYSEGSYDVSLPHRAPQYLNVSPQGASVNTEIMPGVEQAVAIESDYTRADQHVVLAPITIAWFRLLDIFRLE